MMLHMKPRYGLPLAAILSVVGIASVAQAGEPQSFDQIARGRDVSIASDCQGCHTMPGGLPFAGGLALQTPFGKLVAANITPDMQTGIGSWTDEDFYNSLHEGRGKGGELIYPAMPYPAYTKMTYDDAMALRAYLRTVEPVTQDVVSNQLPFPFSIRASLNVWNALNFTQGTFKPDPNLSPDANHGAYLVTALGHCATCHSGKTSLGADEPKAFLTGGLLQGWWAPDITGNMRTGIGGWSNDDIVQYLWTGVNRFSVATGPMMETVTNSTSKMSKEDLGAIATYLKGIRGDQTAAPPKAAADTVLELGKVVYTDNCSMCHVQNGDGVSGLFPKLATNGSVQSLNATSQIRVVLQGGRGVSTQAAPTAPAMPSFGWKLGDAEIAAALTYVRNSWSNAAPVVEASDVKKLRDNLGGAD